jgi:hypothetical protein
MLVYILVILPIVTIIIPMNTAPRTASADTAVSEYFNSRITSTQSRINSLSADANRWNDRYVRSLLAVLFIGLWTLVCQFFAIQRTRMVSDAQSELLHLQDIKAANESRETEALRSQNLETQRRLVAAQEALEQEKKMRLELEKSLAPRDFSAPNPSNVARFDAFMEKENAMKHFAGIEATIEVIPDFEARRAAGIIEHKIKEAGWVVASKTLVDATPDGVTLWRHSSNLLKNRLAVPTAELQSEQAASALAVFLDALGWQDVKIKSGSVGETGGPYVPANRVVIQVGFKPHPFFDPGGVKKIRERYEEIRRKMPASE